VTIKSILRGFELASGLKTNFHKSKLVGINVDRNTLACYTKTLNCAQTGVPFKYLGLEVGGNPRKKQFWESILNKLKARLNVWKGRFLSMAGKICLVKSVITVVPLFYSPFSKHRNLSAKALSVYKGGSYGVGGRRKGRYHG